MISPLLVRLFQDLNQDLNRRAVMWSVVRREDQLDGASGDVDLLVSPDDLPRVRCLLDGLGFVRLPAWGRGSHTFYLGYVADTMSWVKLDIVTALDYGPHFVVQTGAAPDVLGRRVARGDAFVLAPDDGFWTLLLHCVLDKGAVDPAHGKRLVELAPLARTDGPLARTVEPLYPAGWNAGRVVDSVRRGDWTSLLALRPSLLAAWRRRHPFTARYRQVTNSVRRALEKPAVLLHRRGVSVALLGPDGAGKSTLAAGIQSGFWFQARVVYMGLWKNVEGQGGRRRVRAGVGVALRPLVIWWRYLAGLGHRLAGRLVIFDRYTYDALIPPEGSLVWLKRPYFWLLAHLCPAPNMVVVLDVPAEQMYRRKPEGDPAALDRSRQHLLALQHRLRSVQVVDASRAPEAVRADVMQRIWQQYIARWRGDSGEMDRRPQAFEEGNAHARKPKPVR